MFCQRCGEMFEGEEELCPECKRYESIDTLNGSDPTIEKGTPVSCFALLAVVFSVFILFFASAAFVISASLNQLGDQKVIERAMKSINIREIRDDNNETLAQSLIKDAIGEEIDEDKVDRFIEEFEYEEFLSEVVSGYAGIITGQRDEFVIRSEDIVNLFEENEELIESELDIELDYKAITEYALDVEENSREIIDDGVVQDEDVVNLRNVLAPIASGTVTTASIAVMVIILTLLVFVYAKSGSVGKGFSVFGWALLIYSGLGFFATKGLCSLFAQEEPDITELFKILTKPFETNCIVLIAVAAACIAVGIIFKLLKKSQKSQEMYA